MKGTAVLVACILLTGCMSAEDQESEQLSRVAKGWCLTIRASQVIPVYPLTEDLEVGDMFIVQKPLEDEVDEYETSGFLPLGQHLYRLHPTGIDQYYSDIQTDLAATTIPSAIGNSSTSTRSSPAIENPTTLKMFADREDLPLAAFPSYSFQISRSGGAGVELPIKGIPVAFGLLDADSASATVTLSNATTYGLDILDLDQQVRKWASEASSVEILKRYSARYAPPYLYVPFFPWGAQYHKQYNYLRIVTRVFFIRSVDVTVTSTAQTASELRAGNTSPPTSVNSNSTTQPSLPSGDQVGIAGQVTGTLHDPGGQLQLSSHTSNSVTLVESFNHPMAIGYLAFDLPIGEDGTLGDYPVSTENRLFGEGGEVGETTVREWAVYDPEAENKLNLWLMSPIKRALAKKLTRFKENELTSERLRQYLIEKTPPGWIYWIPAANLVFFQQQSLLSSVIAEDIIRRPPGLRQPQAEAEGDSH